MIFLKHVFKVVTTSCSADGETGNNVESTVKSLIQECTLHHATIHNVQC